MTEEKRFVLRAFSANTNTSRGPKNDQIRPRVLRHSASSKSTPCLHSPLELSIFEASDAFGTADQVL